jgi:hypothetical protein
MRLISTLVLATFFAIPMTLTACGGDDGVDADPFDTLEECFTEHHGMEGLSIPHAITTCCLDHPIGGNAAGVVCGTTEASCETYVDANLMTSDAAAADITSACTDYNNQR